MKIPTSSLFTAVIDEHITSCKKVAAIAPMLMQRINEQVHR
ncbi:hypothetical protein M595_3984 [Lyngbya aestuarii BL J]|uniref:Uncharacterized protein n=1 Tax=Lyngbya aestuarii BL J TaxID=1348334 RepID=U7QDY1_9CYAN|nr:hypothetical protein M595_3984 [Lyngbya aestuarii BL J]